MRTILHLDADAFFASVEQSTDARLRGKPVAVGGEKRGIIASASYEARKFGIYTPMPTVMARRLCPKLILLPGDFEKYEFFSRLMFSYAYDFTPDVEIGSIDEGYFDLSGTRTPALGIAETIRRAIRQALKLSVSEGIGSNKLISQIASKLKKPAAFQLVPPGDEARFLSPLANKWLPGVGPKTADQLNAAGLARIGQIAHIPADLLGLLVGNQAPQLRNYALGIDERPVIPARAPAKSYGEQETFAADTTDEEFLRATLRRMADKLMAKVREDGKSIRTLAVKVRYNDMDEEQASESLEEPTDLETELYSRLSMLLSKAWKRRVSLRLVSLKLSNLYDRRFRSALALETSDRQREAGQRLSDVVDDLRQKFGRSVVLRGHDFILRAKKEVNEKHQTSSLKHQGNPKVQLPNPNVVSRPACATALQLNELSPAYNLAVVQRQRVGHYATRTHPSSDHVSRFTRQVSVPCIPLNVHSYYSFLDSTLSINAIVELAKRHELPAIALTDKNNLHGAVEFAQAAAKAGVKPIIGSEIEWNGHRLCLYVQNQTGYQNLCRILNQETGDRKQETGWENSKSQAPSSRETPSSNTDSAIQGSRFHFSDPGDGAGEFATGAERGGDGSSPRKIVVPSKLAGTSRPRPFLEPTLTDGLIAVSPSAELTWSFPNRFYLEANSLEAFEKYRSTTSSLRHPLPCVASFPIHYEKASDRWKYDVVQSIRTLTLLRQQHPEKRLEGEYHFRSSTEMRKLFAASRGAEELLAHSLELAGRCSFEFSLGKPQFPGYIPADGSPPAAFLRRLVMAGLQRCYPKEYARLKSQLEEELAIITDVGYEEYFLVMWDILQECGRRGIEWITRGSAADSLACYCLGISSVCPIRFDLYFRRFLNKDRMALNKLPDIDVDFPHDRKDEVIDLIFEKYGAAQAAIVGGFSTFQSRSAFAEVAKVLGVSEYQVRRITERLPHYSRASELTEAVATTQECRDLPLEEEPYGTALQMAQFLDGFPRYAKMHPCGVVLSRQPMNEIVPCFVSAKGYRTTHFDMDSVEAVGLVKMDILAQGGLAVMRDVKELLEKESGVRNQKSGDAIGYSLSPSDGERAWDSPFEVQGSRFKLQGSPHSLSHAPAHSPPTLDLEALKPWTDPSVWEMIANGHARAVHHIESPAMVSLCKMCNARNIDILIAIVSVIRPGAANESKKMEFARRYQRLSPVRYPHPSLERCLRSTYGLVVYEEHILQICEAFAGLPPGRADVLRRALGKDKAEVIAQIEIEFADCARKLGRTESEIAEVWNLVAGFKGYAFCKAHSTAYGVEAYQSAWLKLHYPAEFMAAVLTNGKGFYDPLVYVLECHRLGIPLLPPSVNEPGPQFTVSCSSLSRSAESAATIKAIRVPVLNMKGLTTRTKEALLRERARGKFASLPDFLLRVQPLNDEMQSLIQAGAFDDFGKTRTTQYWEFKINAECGVRSAECRMQSSTLNPQLSLLPPEISDRLPSVALVEPDRLQRLRWEEELLGYPASGHPLELYPDIAWDTYRPINRLGDHVGEQIVTCGLVIEQRLFHQVTGEPMKFLTIADWTGMVETELFARTYKSYGLTTIRYRVLEITGTVEPFENGRGFTLRVLRAGETSNKAAKRLLTLRPALACNTNCGVCDIVSPRFCRRERRPCPGQRSVCRLLTMLALAIGGDVQPGFAAWWASDAFTNLSFTNPCCLTPEPGTNRLYVCEREGRIFFFTNHPAVSQKTLFLDLSAVTQGNSDCGLVGFVFHPEFGLAGSTNRGFVYVSYSYSPTPTPTPTAATRLYNRLSRFTVPDGTLIANPASELVLINQFDRNYWHNGGGMFFGADGFLYLSNGDEGVAFDIFNNAQVITNGFFSGVFRIDVDMNPARSHPIRRQIRDQGGVPDGWPPTFSANYFVPNDNPWQDAGGSVLEEFFAIGLRNPYRMTFDAPTGRIWAADVGQEAQEEIDLIQKGGNYQWAYAEGTTNGYKAKPSPLIGADTPPIHTYGRSLGRCVIGGYAYRGAQYAPYATGMYFFGDYIAGTIWSLVYDGVSSPVVSNVCTIPQFCLTSFGLDQAGEIYMCSFLDGKILKLNFRPDAAPILVVATKVTSDRVELNFTNYPGLGFSVIGTTNLAWPLSNWPTLGPAQEVSPGIYNFTNTAFPNGGAGFFRVRQP